MKKLKYIHYLLLTTILSYSCGTEQVDVSEQTNTLEISSQQFLSNSMQLGTIEQKIFEDVLNVHGVVTPLANGSAKVYAPINGQIVRFECNNGQYVRKNQVLAEIGGTDIIDLQREFAAISASLKRLEADYQRVKLLFEEKVAAEKEFLLAKSEFQTSLAHYTGLRLTLESVGVSTEKTENGEFVATYYLRAPIDGYVSNVQAHLGFIQTDDELLEIINTDLLQIQLAVYPSDISKVNVGQRVRTKYPNSETSVFATITAVGVAVDNHSKSIFCYADLSSNKLEKLVANMYVESEIVTKTDTVFALPTTAVHKSGSDYYVMVLKEQSEERYVFSKHKVRVGRENNGYYEILDSKIEGPILTKGGYTLSGSE